MEAMCHTLRERKSKSLDKGCTMGRGEEGKMSEKLYLLSKIYGDWVVGFHRSKRQSSFARRNLHVDTKIWGFHQTPRGRGFSPTLVNLDLRVI